MVQQSTHAEYNKGHRAHYMAINRKDEINSQRKKTYQNLKGRSHDIAGNQNFFNIKKT